MLEFLHIKNLALIESMQLEFGMGMNVLTGETGAGKSFIIKALNFVLGEKLETSLIRPNAAKAEVEVLFIHNAEEIIIRRELIAETGRSRFFLNGNLATQEKIKSLRPSLILHASQHGQQKLLQASFQSKLIDGYLDEKALVILQQKDEVLSELREVSLYKKNLIQKIELLRDKRELLESQQETISKVSPEENEEEKLEKLRVEFRSIEKIQALFDRGLTLLRSEPSLSGQISTFERTISQIAAIDENFVEDVEVLQNFLEDLSDIENKLRAIPTFRSEEGYDIETVEQRLFELAQLKRKLRRTIPEIINLQQEVEENLNFLDTAELDLIQADKKEHTFILELQKLLEILNKERAKAAEKFCSLLKNELQGLGFAEELEILPNLIKKEIWHEFQNLNASIEDTYTLLFAPNPGQPPQPLDKIASGGELSRFLLAITSLQAHSELSLLIFDEVDAGIGGNTLNKVSERLNLLAQKQQMLLITHWANLAKYSKKHFFVEKQVHDGNTYTKCYPLTKDKVKIELDRMQGRIK